MSGRQYIDVIGSAQLWPVPSRWSEDPRAGASQSWTSWPEQTPDLVPFLQNLAMSLGGYVAIFAGELAQFPEQLVEEYLAPGQRREPMVARNWYMTDAEWPLFLIRYADPDPASRRAALDLSYACVSFLSEIGPLRSRAGTLLAIYDRVRQSRPLLQFHVSAPYPEVARFWRQSMLSEAEHAVLPEIGGWGAALRWSDQGLQAAHNRLVRATRGRRACPKSSPRWRCAAVSRTCRPASP